MKKCRLWFHQWSDWNLIGGERDPQGAFFVRQVRFCKRCQKVQMKKIY